MSKSSSGLFKGTKGNIVKLIQSLPEKFLEEWTDITHPEARKNSDSIKYKHKESGLEVRFDPKKDGAPGFEGKNHWQVYNQNKTGKRDAYLDENGNPTAKNSNPSHIIPKK